VPTFFGRFERVAEIIVQDRRDVGRDRYRFYRDRGYPLFHHELDEWEAA
jgi:DNA polymerase III subunit chi